MWKRLLAKLLFCEEDHLDGVLLHIPVGIITVILTYVSGWLAVIFGVGYLTYQLSEQKQISDECFPDIQGWLYGIVIGAGIVLVFQWY